MAIQAQLSYNASNANQIGFGGSEFSLVNNNNNGGIGIGNAQSYYLNHLQSQKDFNQQALFHHQHQQQQQQSRSQHFLAVHMEKQKQEIDQFIKIQNERLRYVLQEQRKREVEMILRKMESKALVLMNHKEEEMSKALSKNMELEDLLRKMETENQTWQRLARENEAMVQTLNSTLEQVRERAATCHDAGAAEDEGSYCGGDSFPAEKEKKMSGGGTSTSCCNCGSNGVTRVLFLPCRHLCCCIDCEEGLVLCPICNTPKKNRIEAFIF
ncbi:PREDICTED: probable BOI-related E3 ubiquitin-protein ligase 2 [Camelina sativa]|uniref:Probable BOI-related E3 ubiquitin-protein ligase 2 n=1 Tax=Camelina sativa TaxID=90675 RepID=A0ABM0UVL0_CAMSA|nr:PREDICTED: probable BOI-related E3 ubiquitin-protein ligase 2 [Camelina sativa]